MLKTISAIAIAAALAATLTLLPGASAEVEASTPVAATKGDRLDIRPATGKCAEQAWPYIDASCLRAHGAVNVRLVSTDRR